MQQTYLDIKHSENNRNKHYNGTSKQETLDEYLVYLTVSLHHLVS